MKTKNNENKFAENQLQSLEAVVESGLNPDYKNVNDFLCDFYPDFPWDKDERDEIIKLMFVQSERISKIEMGFKSRFNFSIIGELQREGSGL